MGYVEKLALIAALVETAYTDSAHSERIYLTPSCIDSVLLLLLEDDVKASGDASLG